MVEEEPHYYFSFAIKCGHGLSPLSEVIDYHNDVFMTIRRDRFDFHELYCPFAERLDCDYGVLWCRGGSCFWGKDLIAATMLECLYSISEDRRPEVASA